MVEPQVPGYIRSLVPYVPGKPIEETQREFNIKKVIKLASNENPLGPSPKALLAMSKAAKELHRYPDASGFLLKDALSKHLKVSKSSLILGNGSNEIIDQLIRTYCIAGDAIVSTQAAFIAYKICAQVHGVKTLEVRLDSELKADLGELVSLVKKNERVRMVFIANPNNPTGTYLNQSELKGLIRDLSGIRNGSVVLVLDYAYWEYVTASDLPDAQHYIQDYPNTVILRTFSKIHGLAGLRIGYGISTPELIAHLEKVRQPFNVNSLGLRGAAAALSDTQFIKKARATNAEGMKFWEKQLEQKSIPFWKSQGNFLLVDVKKGLGLSGPEVYQACLQQGVILRPVSNYGLDHALRISIGTPAENRIAVSALDLAKTKLRKPKK
jgi:histidinol-phosphate aminotransferase